MDVAKIINELNSEIKKKYSDLKGIYLYGSRARGDYREDSDIDLIAIFDEINFDKKMRIYGICADLEYKYDAIISLFLYTYPNLEKNWVFHNEVVNKGIYYEAA